MAKWIDDPEAKEIIAELIRRDVRRQEVSGTFGPTDRELRYRGKLVTRLDRIRAGYAERILKRCDRVGTYEAFRKECALSVDQAIDEARLRATETPLDQHLRIRRSAPARRAAA